MRVAVYFSDRITYRSLDSGKILFWEILLLVIYPSESLFKTGYEFIIVNGKLVFWPKRLIFYADAVGITLFDWFAQISEKEVYFWG